MPSSKYKERHRINSEGIEEKKCADCNQWFIMNSENFGKDKKQKDGLNARCKDCKKKYSHENYLKNKEKRIQQALQWRKNNPEKARLQYQKVNHTEKGKLKRRKTEQKRRELGKVLEWQRNNKDKMQKYTKNRQHKNHNITKEEWNSCKEYFYNSCAYCGLSIEEHYRMYYGEQKR